MKKIYILPAILLVFSLRMEAQYAASNFTLVGQSNPETVMNGGEEYSGCWGWYQAEKNKEYAIACSHRGIYWIDITIPSTPTVSAYRTGSKSFCTWRETKSYKNFLYVISDDNAPNRFQIFDMQYLPDSVHKVHDSKDIFERGHTLWVDGDKLYVASVTGSNNAFYHPMAVYSLTNPINPTFIRSIEQDYPFINGMHDMFVRRDTIFASCGYQGLYVFKLTAANTFTQLGSLTSYPFAGYNHSSALTPNGHTLVFLDEVPAGLPVKVADVTNLGNIQVLTTTNQFAQTTPHNPFIVDDQYCFVSAYQDGLQLFDISTPATPVLAGYFDTYPQFGGNVSNYPSGGTYNGQWGAYPYFPSGNIFALDRKNGGFILKTHLYKGPPVKAAFTSSSTACAGVTVNLGISASGSNSYTWSALPAGTFSVTSPLGANVTFTAPGIYTINLQAGNAAHSVTVTHTISVISVSAAVTATNVGCSACSNGVTKANPSGGTSPYTYLWSPAGGTNSVAVNLAKGCYTVVVKDANGCQGSGSACVSYDVGLPDTDNGLFQIYPNPARAVLHIDYPGDNFSYSLFDVTGRCVATAGNQHGKVVLQLDELAKGVYFVEAITDGHKIKKQIIIE